MQRAFLSALLSLCFAVQALYATPTSDEQYRLVYVDGVRCDPDPYTFKVKQLVLPVGLIAAASTSLYISSVHGFDQDVNEELSQNNRKYRFDDYLQYSPIAAVWALNLTGLKPRHGWAEQSTNLLMSALFTAALVNGGKYTIKRMRPDNSRANSFPSGHTSTAFMGAEFLRREYEAYPLVGVLGYATACVVGYMRIHNNKHYFTDVMAGAGVGILSVQMAYWCAPFVNRWLWGSDVREQSARGVHTSFAPYANGEQYGLNASIRF